MENIVLCKPRGGLNDILVQIEKCWKYAIEHNRCLHIDTSRSGLLDDFQNYFILPKGVFSGSPNLQPPFNCNPEFLSNNISDYPLNFNAEKRNYTYTPNGELVTFDFSRSHPHQILVHEQCGGGLDSFHALRKLNLQPKIASHIYKLVSELGEYDAVHVRNTDYKTNYREFFSEIDKKLGDRIVLCTDDFSCQKYAQSIWGNRLKTVTDIPETNGKPLHYNKDIDRFSANLDAITDLILLSLGKNLFFSRLENGYLSGFTRLANELHRRKDVVENLLKADQQ